MENSIKLFVKSNYLLFKLLRIPLALSGYFRKKVTSPVEQSWQTRIETVILSPDNRHIERVRDAGKITGDKQIMHNGIKIHVGSYYGDGNTVLLHKNKGVHEPEEERAFTEIVKLLPPGAVMLELGAFWAFYSMSFLRSVKDGVSYLIEPDPHALLSGKNNFRLNNLKGKFFNYYISNSDAVGQVPTITVDEFLQTNGISKLNILHSDIQGFELKMLMGATHYLKHGKIDYLFISTHSNDLHEDCMNYLKNYGYQILCDTNLDQTYSWDGLIVAKHRTIGGPDRLDISKRQKSGI